MIDRNFDGIFFADGSGGAPLLWQHLSWIFFTGAYMLILIFALGRDRRDRRRLLRQAALQPRRGDRLAGGDRRARHARLDAEHADRADRDRLDVLRDADVAGADRPLRPDLLQPDRDDGRRRAADAGAAAVRGRRRSRRSRSASPPRSSSRWSPSPGSLQEHHRRHRRHPLRAGRRRRLRRLRRAPLLVPEDDRPDDGRGPRPDLLLDDGRRHPARLRAALPRRRRPGPGGRRLQVLRRHRRQRLQPDRHDRRLRPRARDRADAGQRDRSAASTAPAAGHDPWGGDTLEWFALSPPEPHNFDVLPDVRSARPMRDIREAIAHRTARRRAAPAASPSR